MVTKKKKGETISEKEKWTKKMSKNGFPKKVLDKIFTFI